MGTCTSSKNRESFNTEGYDQEHTKRDDHKIQRVAIDWLFDLQVGDKLDILDSQYKEGNPWRIWHNGTIKTISTENDEYKLKRFYELHNYNF